MRYFFFTYTGKPKYIGQIRLPGTVCVSCEDFPNQKDLEAEILEKEKDFSRIVIIGWQEFKSKQDFLSFIGEIK